MCPRSRDKARKVWRDNRSTLNYPMDDNQPTLIKSRVLDLSLVSCDYQRSGLSLNSSAEVSSSLHMEILLEAIDLTERQAHSNPSVLKCEVSANAVTASSTPTPSTSPVPRHPLIYMPTNLNAIERGKIVEKLWNSPARVDLASLNNLMVDALVRTRPSLEPHAVPPRHHVTLETLIEFYSIPKRNTQLYHLISQISHSVSFRKTLWSYPFLTQISLPLSSLT